MDPLARVRAYFLFHVYLDLPQLPWCNQPAQLGKLWSALKRSQAQN